jgi:hypothetical protein
MPRSINGTGTTWYGNALPYPDGSVVVTEWFTIFYAPLIPLGSKRVRFVSDHSGWLTSNLAFYTVQPVPLYIPHILKVYGTWLAILLLVQFLGNL